MAVSARSFRFVFLGGLFAATSVAAGAFGAHALKSILDPSMLAVYETAARYQMYHALGLFVVAWLVRETDDDSLRRCLLYFRMGLCGLDRLARGTCSVMLATW